MVLYQPYLLLTHGQYTSETLRGRFAISQQMVTETLLWDGMDLPYGGEETNLWGCLGVPAGGGLIVIWFSWFVVGRWMI